MFRADVRDNLGMDVLSHSRVAQLRRQGLSWRVAAGRAGASLADVRRTLRDDEDEDTELDPDRVGALAELREEIAAVGGFDAWWRT
jgi:hypothetical protein